MPIIQLQGLLGVHTNFPRCGVAGLSCTAQGPVIGQTVLPVANGLQHINISWSGLTANTDYLLWLIATDTPGNCQPRFTAVPVHTLDNLPPNTLGFDVVQVGGTTAALQIVLDEPATAFYAVMPAGTECPAPAELFLASEVAKPLGAVTAGNASVPQAGVAAVANVSGLSSETQYTACVIAADVTKLQNRQTSAAHKDFRTLDITPPSVSLTVAPGTDGNFTCSRCVLTWAVRLTVRSWPRAPKHHSAHSFWLLPHRRRGPHASSRHKPQTRVHHSAKFHAQQCCCMHMTALIPAWPSR